MRVGACVVMWALASSAFAAAAPQRPADFAWGLPIDADGRAPLYSIELPAAVYQGSARRDLGDLRVFNGAGETVAHALRESTPPYAAPTESQLPLFPLRVPAAIGNEGVDVRVETRADGTIAAVAARGGTPASARLAGFIADASRVERPVRALRFDWSADGDGRTVRVRVEGSDDLALWRTLVADAALLRMELAGHRLESRRIELGATRARYYRVLWSGREAGLELSLVHAEHAAQTAEPALTWKSFASSPVSGKSGEFEVDLGGTFPVRLLRIDLPEPNTVARLEVLSRPTSAQPWRPVAEAVVYRLRQDGRDLAGAPLVIAGGAERHWLLRFAAGGAGIGAGVPSMSVGWAPRELVFAARGGPPFQLAYGRADAVPAALAIEALLPPERAGAKIVIETARVGAPVALSSPAVNGPLRSIDAQRLTLWSVLVIAVLVLGLMAWRLARQLGHSPRVERQPEDEAPASREQR